jgi:hypothetical protein
MEPREGHVPGCRRFPVRRAVRAGLVLAAAAVALGAASALAPAAAEGDSCVSIPFGHRVGEEYALRFEQEEERDGGAASRVATEVRVRVVSPYRDDLLVELTWLAIDVDGRRLALRPRSAENAAALDRLGGGLLLARVARDGTAREVLNWDEVQRALTRHAASGGTASETSLARPVVEPLLLREWNVAYAACGLAMVPERSVETPVEVPDVLGSTRFPAVDTRTIRVARRRDGGVTSLEVSSRLSVVLSASAAKAEGREAASLRILQSGSTSYDVGSGLLAGSQRREVRAAGRLTVTTLRFREARPAPVPDDAALAAR